MKAILMGKEFWLNSMFSVARYYGGITLDGMDYRIVPPADDLVRDDWVGLYKNYGREKVIECLRKGYTDAKKALEYLNPQPKEAKQSVDTQLNLFENE